MRSDLRTTTLYSVLALALAGVAQAQFTRPGSGLDEGERRDFAAITLDSASALWQFGALRVTPILGLRDVRYDSTARSPTSDAEGDVTATVGAGFDAYLPLGSHSVATFGVLPAYTIWKEFTEQNRLIGTYSAGFRGDYNRVRLSLDAQHLEEIGLASPELLQRLPQERQTASLSLELDLSRGLALQLSGSREEIRLGEPESGFEPGLETVRRLDRDTTRGRAGLLLHNGDRVQLGIGIQREVRDFSSADRANEGDSPYVTLEVQGNHLQVSLDVVQRSLAPREGSSFRAVDQTTGRLRLSLTPGWRLTYSVYGGRAIGYSFDESQSHLEDTRLGLGLGLKLSDRSSMSLWSEQGDLVYSAVGGGTPKPDEDITAYGGSFAIEISERSALHLGGGHMEFDSPLPGADRDWNFFMAGVSVTFSKVRVEIGSGG